MNSNPESQRGPFDDLKSASCFLAFVAQTLAVSVEPFLHGRFGSRYFGMSAAAVFLAVPLFTMGWDGYDARPLIGFLAVYLLMCFFARLGMLFRTLRNQHVHSYYSGTPHLLRLFPKLDEITVKRGIEPLIVFLIGAFALPYSPPLGSYLVIAAFGLLASVHLKWSYEKQRVHDMHDAYLEQSRLAEQFRRMRGDPF